MFFLDFHNIARSMKLTEKKCESSNDGVGANFDVFLRETQK